MSYRCKKNKISNRTLKLSAIRKKNRGSNLKAWRNKQKLLAEMAAAGITVENQASSSTSDVTPHLGTILPNMDMQPENLSGIFIKQEIIEAEEEESPSFILNASSIAAQEMPTDGRLLNVSSTSAAPPKDQFDIFGELIAIELRNMDANTSSIVQKIMSELVNDVKLGKRLTDEEKTNLALTSSNLRDRINSVHKSKEMILPDVDQQDNAPSDMAMEESPSVVSECPPTVQEKCSVEVSGIQASCYPQETKPTVFVSSKKEAKVDSQKSPEKHNHSMDNKFCDPATGGCEKEFTKLKAYSQSNCTVEATDFLKAVKIGNYPNVGLVQSRSQCDIFGEFIVIELKNMDAFMNTIVQKLISELIFEAKLGKFRLRLGSKEKTNLNLKSCIFVNRLNSVDENLNDKANHSVEKTNQNHLST